ncbi:MAG: hypothetical protein ABL966_14645, partial [Acidimicrobiales bacterium]
MTDAVGDSGPSTFLDSLGDRGWRRAEPRTSIAIAGAGCALAVLGVLVVAGDTGLDDSGGDFNKVPGIVLAALVVAAGYVVLSNFRKGPLATAGAAAAALGVPALMFFLTFDQEGFPPYNTEGILLVSTGVWLASYALGPGRGRPFFLGAGLIGLWLTVLQLTEKVFTAPFDLVGGFFGTEDSGGTFDPETGEFVEIGGGFGSPDVPDAATIGMLSLALGLGFLLMGRWLDRNGRHGVATPFALATLPCLFVGVTGLAPDLEAAGTGLLLIGIGLGLAYHGATMGRRITAWIGAAAMANGAAVFLIDMGPEDDATVSGMLLLAGGIAMVFAAHALATALHEPDEMTVTVPAGPGPARAAIPPPPMPESP